MKPRSAARYDVYVDLLGTQLPADVVERHAQALAALLEPRRGQRIMVASRSKNVLLRDQQAFAPPPDVLPLAHALRLAELDGRGLVVVRGAWLPRRSQLDALAALAGLDSNIGTVQPRFVINGSVVGLPRLIGLPSPIPCSVLALLPDLLVLPELDSPCSLITPQAVPACADDGALPYAQLQVKLRRRGFRTLVVNNILMDYPLPPASVYVRRPDPSSMVAQDQAREWIALLPVAKLESMLSGAAHGDRKRLLLDCRGMTSAHNGSADAVLGYLLGIASIDVGEWDITVCVGREAGEFHGLMARFPEFNYEFERPGSKHLVALHLTQPWSYSILRELHECAPLIAFNILDTIAWDAIYPAPADLDRVTRLAARFADGILYLSDHSRKRFRLRFTPHRSVVEAITYLSTSPTDYETRATRSTPNPQDILVIGNRLDHKDVDNTADKLAQAFPFNPIVAFGGVTTTRANVRVVPSGHLPDLAISKMLNEARVIVYPSFAEGFGIPVVRGLALGKPVIVRDLPLWDEIRERTGAATDLRTFQSDAELVDAVGSSLAMRRDRPRVKTGNVITWADCGGVLLDFAADLVESFSYERWEDRDLAFAAIA